MKNHIKRKFLYVLSSALAIALLLAGRGRIAEWLHGQDSSRISTSELLEAESLIPIKDGDTRTREKNVYDKVVIAAVEEHLHSSSPASDVIDYYLRSLPPLKWHLESDKETKNGRKIKFCKLGVSLIIEATDDGAGASYYFGLAWTKYRQSNAHCPPSKV